MILAARYFHLTPIIQELKPAVILEVGTWNGERAIQMVRASGMTAKYIGFDLFEQADAETDKEEHNRKKHYTEQQVAARLRESGIDYELVKGNTRSTLNRYARDHATPFVDFAFIDGGHSLTTITSDWKHIRKLMKPGGVVVFDDYYTVDPAGHVGANPIVDKIEGFSVLPLSDILHDKTKVQLAMVRT